ncbi:MAG: TIGR00341 family protein, partial [Flavobacterium sp.]
MNRLQKFLDLHTGEENKQKVLENVKANISFRGASVWILACAIVVASVGLNVNSTAVIIGAMLISPLMGPIVGAGFSLGIYDFELLKKAAKNLVIATLVSLLVSTIYFILSPFKETQSELLARTSPNIYDILIAFFGGLVGVIAITRVEKGNPIPGVAIATALMPPLCTAGYGLAIGNWKYFFGALFLYTINCVFICISTFVIVKYLKYPEANHINPKYRKQIKYTITIITVLLIMPSVYFAYLLAQEKKYN